MENKMKNTPIKNQPDHILNKLDEESFNSEVNDKTVHEYMDKIKELRKEADDLNWWQDIDLSYYIQQLLD